VVRKDATYAWDVVDGSDGFRRVTLLETDWRWVKPSAVAKAVKAALEREQPAAVLLPGWSAPEALAGLEWAVQRRIPAILMSASQQHDRPRRKLVEWIKHRVARLYSAALVGGSKHAAYVASLGMPAERVFTGYDVVDNAHFAAGTAEARRNITRRSEMGLPSKYFMTSCRFEPVKNLPRLLQAYAHYRQLVQEPWALVLLGDGSLKTQVQASVEQLGLRDSVLLPGFRQYGELPAYYGYASAFILASTSEPWGLVVNEAMAAGLPVLVSDRCGCAPELVQEGGNGFTFDPYNVEALAQLMVRISTMEEGQREIMGRRSIEIISNWGPERFAKELREAIKTAINVPSPQLSFVDRLLLRALIYRPQEA